MGDSILDNIRSGDWLMEYTLERIGSQISLMPRLQSFYDLLAQAFSEVKKLPGSYKPRYVSRVMEKFFNAAISLLTHSQMNESVAFR